MSVLAWMDRVPLVDRLRPGATEALARFSATLTPMAAAMTFLPPLLVVAALVGVGVRCRSVSRDSVGRARVVVAVLGEVRLLALLARLPGPLGPRRLRRWW